MDILEYKILKNQPTEFLCGPVIGQMSSMVIVPYILDISKQDRNEINVVMSLGYPNGYCRSHRTNVFI